MKNGLKDLFKMKQTLKKEDFANLFGIKENELPSGCVDMIKSFNFNYSVIEGSQRDKLLLNIFKRIEIVFPWYKLEVVYICFKIRR